MLAWFGGVSVCEKEAMEGGKIEEEESRKERTHPTRGWLLVALKLGNDVDIGRGRTGVIFLEEDLSEEAEIR